MADKEPSKSKKRKVKNPETFRERALKANEPSAKPGPKVAAKSGGSKMSKLGRGLSGFKPLQPVIKVLRLIGKVVIPSYFRNSWKELKLVTWPSWQESRRLTFAVLIFAVIFGATIAVVDYGLDKVFRNVLLK